MNTFKEKNKKIVIIVQYKTYTYNVFYMCFSLPPNPQNCSCPLSYLLTFPILCFALLCPPSTNVITPMTLP